MHRPVGGFDSIMRPYSVYKFKAAQVVWGKTRL